jgi:Zn-dependent peptidase ImmA (M78 family)
MHLLTDKISKLQIGWNERPLTEADFYCLCKRFDVRVIEAPLHTRGFYFRLMGRDIIAVDCRLSGAARLVVLFHELGHFLFHIPESGPAANFHNVGRRTRQEIEADIFALCALIPKKLIETSSIAELVYEGIPGDLAAARFDIYRQHGV